MSPCINQFSTIKARINIHDEVPEEGQYENANQSSSKAGKLQSRSLKRGEESWQNPQS